MKELLSIILGLVLVRGAAAQQPIGSLTALSAEEQTRLALSTAPPEVSSRASLYVLTPNKGYRQVRTGTNGFSCLVERAFLEALEPVCYDAEGSATTLQAVRNESSLTVIPTVGLVRRNFPLRLRRISR